MLIGLFRSATSVVALQRALTRVDQAQALVDSYADRIRGKINQAIVDRQSVVDAMHKEIDHLVALGGK
jgi:hypothetical protein